MILGTLTPIFVLLKIWGKLCNRAELGEMRILFGINLSIIDIFGPSENAWNWCCLFLSIISSSRNPSITSLFKPELFKIQILDRGMKNIQDLILSDLRQCQLFYNLDWFFYLSGFFGILPWNFRHFWFLDCSEVKVLVLDWDNDI